MAARGLPPHRPLAALATDTAHGWGRNPQTCRKSRSQDQEQGLCGQVDLHLNPIHSFTSQVPISTHGRLVHAHKERTDYLCVLIALLNKDHRIQK